MEELDWAWAAGLIDGEGCFCLSNHKGHVSPAISVIMTHEPTLLELKRIFKAGTIYHRPAIKTSKPSYQLNVNRAMIFSVAKRLAPYLRTKKRQAELMLEYCEKCLGPFPSETPIEIRALREVLRDEMQELNTIK